LTGVIQVVTGDVMVFPSDLLDIHGSFGKLMSSDSRVSRTIRAMARLRNHLWFPGMTY
jgi:hypothetical protein